MAGTEEVDYGPGPWPGSRQIWRGGYRVRLADGRETYAFLTPAAAFRSAGDGIFTDAPYPIAAPQTFEYGAVIELRSPLAAPATPPAPPTAPAPAQPASQGLVFGQAPPRRKRAA